ncbi:hypothetical protein KA005_22550, partial [bacterium]|nr:hypothetical protein [bacterium]
DEGGDFIKLISDMRGISLKDAAEEIVKSCGMEAGEKPKKEKKVAKKKALPEPLYPIPNTETVRGLLNKRVRESWISDKWGMAKKIYQYKNIDSQWLFSVCRFEQVTGEDGEVKKNFIPFYYTHNAEWFSKAHDKFRPYQPFGIEKIKDNDKPVLIVEGEKCGQCEVAGYNVLSWFGGSSKSGQTDWSILRDRKVVIWPDADSQRDKAGELRDIKAQPGMKAAYKIKADLSNAVIMDIYKYKAIESEPDGWDLADCIDEGIDPLEVIEKCKPKENIQVEINSHDMFKKFVKHFYDNNSLEQNSGIYWNYRKDLHYWQTEDKNNIICNMQRWLEDTKLHW